MKIKYMGLIAGAGALLATAAIARHHEGEGKYDWEEKMAAHFAKVDTSGDGNISRDEFLAYKAAEAEKEWEKHAQAAGDDGLVSLEEAKAHHKAKKEKHGKKHKKKDQ